VVSHAEVNRRLREFVCVRLDHEQMQRLRKTERLVTPTQGNQVLLDPQGNYIPGIQPRGKRYKIDELIGLLDQVLEQHPPKEETGDDLRLAWFLNNPEDQGLPRYFGPQSIGCLDRKPVATIAGPIPEWLDDPDFLRRHVRQFVWTRSAKGSLPRLTIQQHEPEPRRLAEIDLDSVTATEAVSQLDAAWLAYMKARPFVARGYIDNEHGNWLKAVMERAYSEELQVKGEAESGILRPPGRE
jgi:hypothetical protein